MSLIIHIDKMEKQLTYKDKIAKIKSRDDLTEEERNFINNINCEGYPTYEEQESIDKIYEKYFIDFERSKKENKSLGDFTK